jgi:small GTP-binding protein
MTSIQKKVCLLGDFAVGKTSLVRRFIEGIFEDKYLSTIGVKVDRKTIKIQQDSQAVDLTMLLWDLVGGEKFDRIISTYYRGAAGAVLVGDLTRAETLKKLVQYSHDFRSVNPQAPLIVVGNKIDLIESPAAVTEELAALSAQCQAPWFISSAKTGESVETLFQTMGQQLLGII